jgi:hypothetical protein
MSIVGCFATYCSPEIMLWPLFDTISAAINDLSVRSTPIKLLDWLVGDLAIALTA